MRRRFAIPLILAALLAGLFGPAGGPGAAHAGARVLCYHGFNNNRGAMTISMSLFEEHLKLLKNGGYNVVSLDTLAGFLDRGEAVPPRTVVITIDDGWDTVMHGFELLKKYDLPFALFLPMEYMANPASRRTLDKAQLDELATWPQATMANHSFSHRKQLAEGPYRGLESYTQFARRDIAASKERFKALFGRDSRYFAYPYGRGNPVYAGLLNEAGLDIQFVTGFEPVTAETPKTAIPRVAAHALSVATLKSIIDNDGGTDGAAPRGAVRKASGKTKKGY